MTRPKGALDSARRALHDTQITHRIAAYALLAGLLTLSACSAFTSEEPPIADSTMVEVLIELHLAEARLDLRYDVAPVVRDSILAKHGLNEQGFRSILDYWADHPDAYAALYTTVLDRLSDERLRQGEGLPLSQTPPPGLAEDED